MTRWRRVTFVIFSCEQVELLRTFLCIVWSQSRLPSSLSSNHDVNTTSSFCQCVKHNWYPAGRHHEELDAYLELYESLPLSIPGAMAICDSSSVTKRRKLNTTCAVKLNPALNYFQQSVAQEALDLATEMTVGVDAFAPAILGYLSLFSM